MQQYKFRGKRKSDSEWVYGSLVNSAGVMYIVDASGGLDSDFYDRPIWLDTWEVIPETVGMWTGEVDSKEQDIYAGDIVEDSEVRYEVRYGSWTDAFECGGVGFYLYPVSENESFIGALNPDDMKVLTKIGSIHDNPELLTSK